MEFATMFGRGTTALTAEAAEMLTGYSIEVLPRHAAELETIRAAVPRGTRIYVAQTEGTAHEEVARAAAAFAQAGYRVMPHMPARLILDAAMLGEVLGLYRRAGVEEVLLVAGGNSVPVGDFTDSMQMLETGLFERSGIRRIHVAGHPEGNPAADAPGSTAVSDSALLWKQRYGKRAGIAMGIATQFLFDADAAIRWERHLRQIGVTLPVFIGVPGPTRLTTLLRYAMACGVGPSLAVLQRRAADITRMMKPYEPADFIATLARHRQATPASLIESLHFFAFGGVVRTAEWANAQAQTAP